MITLSWNCRGLAQATTILSLRALIRKHHPDILFLSETKASPSVSTIILRQLGFSLMIHAPPSGSKGGLLLAWPTDVNIVSFYVSCNIIYVWHYFDDPCIKCLLAFVYGPPYKNLCADFWTAMDNFGASYNDPWVCIGDFNANISPNDKVGGRPFDSYYSNPFTDFMDGYRMINLGFCGNPYTWSNHRQGSSLIKERLDRGIANCNWINYFPSYSVLHFPAHTSDHSPLLLKSNLPVQSLPRPFRFEAFWTRDPTCGIVINEAWSALIVGSPSFCLLQKLKITKAAIKYWNKHYFGNINNKLDCTLSLLDKVQQAPPSDSNLAMELHLQELLDEYLKQEESL
jgi:exonuclease III